MMKAVTAWYYLLFFTYKLVSIVFNDKTTTQNILIVWMQTAYIAYIIDNN